MHCIIILAVTRCSSVLLCVQAERKLSSGDSPPVFKAGAKHQQQMEAMQRSGLAALKAAVKRKDMFSEKFEEKDLVRFVLSPVHNAMLDAVLCCSVT